MFKQINFLQFSKNGLSQSIKTAKLKVNVASSCIELSQLNIDIC